MSRLAVPAVMRTAVRQRAVGLCEYCLSSERASGHYFEVDHVLPLSKGGATILDNLALACRGCNARKADRVDGLDSETGQVVDLFNPRLDAWSEHFAWDDEQARILPLTAVGRVTVDVLALNGPLIVGARVIWRSAGLHPPARPVQAIPSRRPPDPSGAPP